MRTALPQSACLEMVFMSSALVTLASFSREREKRTDFNLDVFLIDSNFFLGRLCTQSRVKPSGLGFPWTIWSHSCVWSS